MNEERLGRYAVEEILGRGGMGTVYAGRDTADDSRVALKVLSGDLVDDEERFLRFEQEVTALKRIDHPNIVRLLGPLQRDGERVFFPMEIIEGETLSKKLLREGPQPVIVALAIVRALLRALDAAHRAGIVHRDVKPSNIIVSDTDLKVTDFGLARMEDITRLTRTGQLMGTLEYMSPEQCEGEVVDPRTDLYSAGIILYEMLAGKPPFNRATPGTILKGHLTETPRRIDELRADLPDGLAEIVARLLAKAREDRYDSAAKALAALEGIPDPSTTVTFHATARPKERARPASPGRRRLRPAVIASGLLLLVVAGLLLWSPLFSRRAGTGRDTPEETLIAVHAAIGEADWEAFRICFEAEAVDQLTAEDFRARAAEVSDTSYRLEMPLRGAASGDLRFRVGSSPALALVLGRNPGSTLRLAFRHQGDGFSIARISAEIGGAGRPGGPGGLRGEFDERAIKTRIAELFNNLDTHLPALLQRLERSGRITPEQATRLTERAATVISKGPVAHRIIEEESTFEGGRAEVVVACPKLAKLLGLEDDRFVIELNRRGGGGGGGGSGRENRAPRIRPVDR
jgi:Protein kinase domain